MRLAIDLIILVACVISFFYILDPKDNDEPPFGLT